MREKFNSIKKNFLDRKIDVKTVFKELDELFINFFYTSFKNLKDASDFSLIATGSFAKKTLSFYSDIDILILTDNSYNKAQDSIIENFIYPLWDLKIQVGYSVRSIDEYIGFASNDVVELTKLFNCKFIIGNKNIYNKFITKATKYFFNKKHIDKILKELLILNDDRREKAGALVYNLEPDIKNNPGALRDIDIIFWFDILNKNFHNTLTKTEKNFLYRANIFFLTLRNISHAINNKKNDILSFENQNNIAQYLYPSRKNSSEYLMKKFYFYADNVDYVYEFIREQFFSKFLVDTTFNKKIDNNFYIENFKLHMYDYSKLYQNLHLILRAFLLSQKYKIFLSYELRKALKANVSKININFIKNKKNINLFFNILEKGYGIVSTLRVMNQLNFLQYFIPEFKKIKYKIIYEHYHKYTVDLHSLLVIHELRNLLSGFYLLEFPFISALSLNIPNKKYLLLSGLIHDIGKGEEGKESHLIKGERIAEKICKRMNISKKYTNLIKFLVRNHTLMINTALRRDIKNEEEILNFAKSIKNIQNLNYLFLLSFADIKAVSPTSLDKWKYAALQELYIKTFSVIKNKKFAVETIQEKINHIRTFLLENIPKKEELKLNKFLSNLSRRLIQNFDEKNILYIYNLLKKNKELPIVDIFFSKETDTLKIVTIYYNYEGVFNKIVGILSLNNFNIISAEIYTNRDGTIIDIFEVKTIFDDFYIQEKIPALKNDFIKYLSTSSNNSEFFKTVENKILQYQNKKTAYNIIPIIKFNNKDNQFFTILEIIAKDFVGFLYFITKILRKFNIEIQSSKITTQGIKAIDTFYIADINGNKIIDNELQKKIKNNIIELINEHA